MNNKKHYFLKLKEDFFQQEKIMILENNKNGLVFSNIILKLYLLSMKNNGELLLSEDVPYTPELIARQTGHKLALVEQALDQFKQLNLLKELENGTLKVVNYGDLVGSITSEGERKRAYRSRLRERAEWDNFPPVSPVCPTDGTVKSTSSPTTDTQKSLENPTTDTQKSPENPTIDTQKSTTYKDTSTEIPEQEQQPYSYSPPRGKKSGEETPTIPKGKRLKPPKIPIEKPDKATMLKSKPEETSTT